VIPCYGAPSAIRPAAELPQKAIEHRAPKFLHGQDPRSGNRDVLQNHGQSSRRSEGTTWQLCGTTPWC